MSRIDTKDWKEFKVGDLFEQDRGKEKSPKQSEDGDCMLVSETNISNGFTKEVKPTKIFKGNCLTVSVNYAETVFYQPDDFCASVNITTLRNEHLNRYNGLFLATRLAINNRKYNYINKISKDLLNNTYLSLPATDDGEPYWVYMEDYIKNLEDRVKDTLDKFSQKNTSEKIDTRDWKEFKVGDLFEIHPTKAYKYTNKELLDNGTNPVVVNTSNNNGIGGTSTQEPTEDGNMITFSDTVDANTIFYQKKPFIGYAHVQGLYPVGKYKEEWTKYSLQYFLTVFRQKALAMNFDYGNKFRRDIAVNLTVKLPVDNNGELDWVYMEDYMKQIEQKATKKLDLLKVNEASFAG